MRTIVSTLLVACALVALAGEADAQRLLGVDTGCTLWDFTSATGGVCPAPNPVRDPCPYCQPTPCGGPTAGPIPVGSLLGDVATDSLTDVIYVTDGFVIEEYVGDTPCNVPPPCTPLSSYFVPTLLGMGPLTGMGLDELGMIFGVPTLWITDGLLLAAINPPAVPCGAPVVLCGPLLLATSTGAPVTDVTWDPFSRTLWACDAVGAVHSLFIPLPCAPGAIVTSPTTFFPPSCGLVPPLHGIAYDLATPGFRATDGHLYVTDGTLVEYVAVSGAPASPQFYTPVPCTPTNAPLQGLAYAAYGINYGFPRNVARIGSFGQSSSPGATFGLEWLNEPPGTTLVALVANFQLPGPGVACPPVPAAGTLFWVDPFRPTTITIVLPPFSVPCVPVPAPIPAGFAVPPGLKVFCQFIFRSGAFTIDATEGLEFTITAP